MVTRRHQGGAKLDSLELASMKRAIPTLSDDEYMLMMTGGETDEEVARAEAMVIERRDAMRVQKQANTRDKKPVIIDDDSEFALAIAGCEPI